MPHDCINEQRISNLERDTAVNNTSINNLAEKVGDVAKEIKWLVRLLISILIVALGYFLSDHFGA